MIKHYVEFIYPGIIVSESSSKLIKNRGSIVELPNSSFGYRFFDREEIKKNGEVLMGKRKNISHWHYEGKRYSLADIERLKPNERILISNMRNNKIDYVCCTNFGLSIPIDKGDVIIVES